MTDWATSLRAVVDKEHPGAAEVIGLRPELPGDQFETNLGEFLAFQHSLDLVNRMAPLGNDIANQPRQPYFIDWHLRATNRAAAIVEIIRRNLFENFGSGQINRDSARTSYGELFEFLESLAPTTFALATTNYDPAIEIALTGLGFHPDDGFTAIPYTSSVLEPSGMAERAWGEKGIVPVLHLHGAVGWYRDDKNRVVRYEADLGYNSTHGAPALVLPDSTKTAESFKEGVGLWLEFENLLKSCTHVLFVGHSLHDGHLVKAVRDARKPVAVGCFSGDPSLTESESLFKKSSVELKRLMPEAHVVPMTFGPNGNIRHQSLVEWFAHGKV